jgi:hypothetical protein
MKATEIQEAGTRMLWFGGIGAGKTYLLGQLHEELKKKGTRGLKMFDVDRGFNTLRAAGFDVDVSFYNDPPGKPGDAFWKLSNDLTRYERDNEDFGGFAIDSLTTLQRIAMTYVHRIAKDIKRPLGFLSSKQDYGILIELLNQMFPQFINIAEKSIFVLTAHVKLFEDQASSSVIRTPNVVGKSFPSSVGLWFNEVWYLSTTGRGEAIEYVAQTQHDIMLQCKSQTPYMRAQLPAVEALKLVIEHCPLFSKTATEPTADAENPEVQADGKEEAVA